MSFQDESASYKLETAVKKCKQNAGSSSQVAILADLSWWDSLVFSIKQLEKEAAFGQILMEAFRKADCDGCGMPFTRKSFYIGGAVGHSDECEVGQAYYKKDFVLTRLVKSIEQPEYDQFKDLMLEVNGYIKEP